MSEETRLILDELQKINGRLDKMDGRLDKMDGRLDKMDARLDKMDERFDAFELEYRESMNTIGNMFEETNRKIDNAVRILSDRIDSIQEITNVNSLDIVKLRARKQA